MDSEVAGRPPPRSSSPQYPSTIPHDTCSDKAWANQDGMGGPTEPGLHCPHMHIGIAARIASLKISAVSV